MNEAASQPSQKETTEHARIADPIVALEILLLGFTMAEMNGAREVLNQRSKMGCYPPLDRPGGGRAANKTACESARLELGTNQVP